MDTQLITVIAIIVGITSYSCFYICKWSFEYCCHSRERYRIAPEDIQRVPAIEMRPPRYEEDAEIIPAIPASSDLATRRLGSENVGQDNTAFDNSNCDTRLNEEVAGCSNTAFDNSNGDSRLNEEAAGCSNENYGQDNTAFDNSNDDTRLHEVAAGCSSSGNDGNNTENSRTRRTGVDTDVIFYIGEPSNVIFSSRNKKDNNISRVPVFSAVNSNNGDYTVDDAICI